jgi:ABC-type nitrate/sulfonate/bicarbonate transport system substrate-binding protein
MAFAGINRRRFGAMSAGLLAYGAARGRARAAPSAVSVGWVKSTSNLLVPTSIPLAAKNGIELESVNFNTAVDAVTAMTTGQLAVGLLTPLHMLRALESKLDFVQIAGNSRGGTGIVVSKALNLKENDWDGLKAALAKRKLKVASSRGSINELLAIGEFRKNGIELSRDLDLMNIANFAQHPQALRSGEFDMIVTLEPMATMVTADGTGTLFSHPYNTAAGDLNTCFCVRRDWLAANGDQAAAFVRTLGDASAALADKAVQISSGTRLTGLPAPIVEQALANTRFELRNGVAETKALAKLAVDVQYLRTDVAPEIDSHIDDSLLKKAGLAT